MATAGSTVVFPKSDRRYHRLPTPPIHQFSRQSPPDNAAQCYTQGTKPHVNFTSTAGNRISKHHGPRWAHLRGRARFLPRRNRFRRRGSFRQRLATRAAGRPVVGSPLEAGMLAQRGAAALAMGRRRISFARAGMVRLRQDSGAAFRRMGAVENCPGSVADGH